MFFVCFVSRIKGEEKKDPSSSKSGYEMEYKIF